MPSKIAETKRIAKNTVVLYICTIASLLVMLCSSRLLLQALGVDDFGLFNVVCGVAALLSFMKASLTISSQRFLSFEMGKGSEGNLSRVFSMSLTTHFLICIIIVILAETIGLWILNTQLVISPSRMAAANWIYQFSIVSLCFSTVSVPYSAVIISHERMTFYAVVHLIASVLKLLSAIFLFIGDFDKLIVYGLLITVVEIITFLLYVLYCRVHYAESKYKFTFDTKLFNQIFSFSTWTILGEVASAAVNYGMGILVNMFYTLVANAAIGIGQQVNNAISGLTSNFQTAFQPQITKSCASNDSRYLNSIICQTAKISYFLLFIISIPIIMNIDLILKVWLDTVPEHANDFCVLFLVASWINAVSIPLMFATYATGNVRNYQIVTSLVFFLDLVIVWILFRYFDVPPTVSMVVKAFINFAVLMVRLYFTANLIKSFSASTFMRSVMMPCLICTVIILAPTYSCINYISNEYKMLGISVAIAALSCLTAYYIGFNRQERCDITNFVKSFRNKS